MAGPKFSADDLQLAIEDHSIISLLIGNASRMLMEKPTPNTRKAVEATSLLLHRKLLDHFDYEDRHVFGPVLAARPGRKVTRLILGLRKEHDLLLKRVRQLSRATARADFAKSAGRTWQSLMVLLTDLEDHATAEDGLFEALLENAPHLVATTR